MMRVSTFFLLTTFSLSEGAPWSYDFNDQTGGPWQWGALQGSFCGSNQMTSQQSPISICGSKIDEGLMLGAEATWKYVADLSVENNGHTIQVNFDPATDPPTTVNSLADKVERTIGAGDITWEASQVHFHFGRTGKTDEGSEHHLNNKAYPMEAHFVHFNTKYADIGAAVASGNTDALLVIGVVFSVTAQESAFVTAVGNAVAGATKAATPLTTAMGDFAKFAEVNMLAQDAMFSTYPGSLTTPTCNEIVTWVVMDRPCMVTAATLAKFKAASSNPSRRRRLRSLAEGVIGTFGNFRRIQAWNYETIWSNSVNSAGLTSCPLSMAERQAKQATANNCPMWGQFLLSFCDWDGGNCDREPTEAQATAICKEFADVAKCAADQGASAVLESFCSRYAWVVTYPDCPMGYWDSGCGQEASTQKASGVVCMGYKVTGGPWWGAKDAMCTATKPDFKVAQDKACPATAPCSRCKGCKRDGDCWETCGDKAGLCAKCDSADGRKGACCMPSDQNDPSECAGMDRMFTPVDVHTCFVTPVEKEDCRNQLCNGKAGLCSACDSGDRQGACCNPDSTSDPSECGIAEWIADKKDIYSCALLPGDKLVGSVLSNILARLTVLESQ